MWCKRCDYALWNLPSRVCPECGEPFKPSEFEFVPNTVEFCCPHCEQPYYGATPKTGHLEPREFICVQCGRRVHMDEMMMRPAPGVKERDTKPIRMPWRERKEIGFWRGWIRTVGLALIHPRRLMLGSSIDPAGQSRITGGWGFFLFTSFLIYTTGMAPLLLDAFFKDMAITIMFGLGFATVLTLIFVPVLYSIFFKIKISQ